MDLSSTPPVTQNNPVGSTVTSKPPTSSDDIHFLNSEKAKPVLAHLKEVEDALAAFVGKPGHNPFIYIQNTIIPIRSILSVGTKPVRYDEPKEVTDARVAKFEKALKDGMQVSAEQDNARVEVPVAPTSKTEKQTNGTETVLKPVE